MQCGVSKINKNMIIVLFSALYSTGSSAVEGGGEREVLVQHLLVKEDDEKLLLDLQKRLSAG
jgi:hypothetical protein